MSYQDLVKQLTDELATMPDAERIEALNQVRTALHAISPLRHHPVDLVIWVPAQTVQANDYNPNVTAPPEMELLERSIAADGYTQPIVTWQDGDRLETVDGFHRGKVGRESPAVQKSTLGFLPVTLANTDRTDRGDRIASTIRHNRARGKHVVANMSVIVQELTRRKWSPEKIGKELGMDADEVLRLRQITGLAEMFADRTFSEAWEIVDEDALNISESEP
jgi:ParB-like chromosome segregation protein Spo0J